MAVSGTASFRLVPDVHHFKFCKTTRGNNRTKAAQMQKCRDAQAFILLRQGGASDSPSRRGAHNMEGGCNAFIGKCRIVINCPNV